MRTFAAFLAAPLTIVLAVVLMDPSLWGFGAFLTIFYGYPVMLLVGLPSYLYLKRRGRLTLMRAAVAGAIVGALLPALALLLPLLTASVSQLTARATSSAFAFIGLGTVLGALSAFIFWLIAIGPRKAPESTVMPPNKSLERTRVE